jgi:hypothetical protein
MGKQESAVSLVTTVRYYSVTTDRSDEKSNTDNDFTTTQAKKTANVSSASSGGNISKDGAKQDSSSDKVPIEPAQKDAVNEIVLKSITGFRVELCQGIRVSI